MEKLTISKRKYDKILLLLKEIRNWEVEIILDRKIKQKILNTRLYQHRTYIYRIIQYLIAEKYITDKFNFSLEDCEKMNKDVCIYIRKYELDKNRSNSRITLEENLS